MLAVRALRQLVDTITLQLYNLFKTLPEYYGLCRVCLCIPES